MADNMAATTAAAPATKSARTGHQQDERTAAEANPPSSNSWVAMTPDPVPEQPASVPMTAADERHMKEDLGRDPAELLHRQLDNQRHMEERKEQLQQAAPGNNLDDMAAADAVGINPSKAAAAAPQPTADQVDGNRISSIEEKSAEGPFLRRETGT